MSTHKLEWCERCNHDHVEGYLYDHGAEVLKDAAADIANEFNKKYYDIEPPVLPDETCYHCNGSGRMRWDGSIITCDVCGGSGFISA